MAAEQGLFIGWGEVKQGREQAAGQVFHEALQYFQSQVQNGTLDDLQAVGLRVHGGELRGFFLLEGQEDKLQQMEQSQEFRRIINRANAVVDDLGVVPTVQGNTLGQRIRETQEHTVDLSGGNER